MARNKAAVLLLLLLPVFVCAQNLNRIFEGTGTRQTFPAVILQETTLKPSDEEIEQWLNDLGLEKIETRDKSTALLFKHFKRAKEKIQGRLNPKGDGEAQSRLKWILKEAPRDPRARDMENKLPAGFINSATADLTDKALSEKEEDFAQVLEFIMKNPYREDIREAYPILSKPIFQNLLKNVPDWKTLKLSTKKDLLNVILRLPGKLDDACGPSLENLLKDNSAEVRSNALQVIGFNSLLDREDRLNVILSMLEDSHEDVILTSLRVLKLQTYSEARKKVKDLLRHPNRYIVRECFLYFWSLFRENDPDTIAAGEQILRSTPELMRCDDGIECRDIIGAAEVMRAFVAAGILENYRPELRRIAKDSNLSAAEAARYYLEEDKKR